MNIQINTEEKTIKVDKEILLSDLFDLLNRFFPTGDWKEYHLQTNVVVNPTAFPIFIEKHYFPAEPTPMAPVWVGPPWPSNTGPHPPIVTVQVKEKSY